MWCHEKFYICDDVWHCRVLCDILWYCGTLWYCPILVMYSWGARLKTGRSEVRTPLALQTDVSSKATNQAVSRGFPYKKLEVGTSQGCNWILWHTWKHLVLHNKRVECSNPGNCCSRFGAKSPAIERAARLHNNCLRPDYRINPRATSI